MPSKHFFKCGWTLVGEREEGMCGGRQGGRQGGGGGGGGITPKVD